MVSLPPIAHHGSLVLRAEITSWIADLDYNHAPSHTHILTPPTSPRPHGVSFVS